MDDGDIAGIKPVLSIHSIGLCLEIALHDPRAANLQPARAGAIAGQDIILIIDNAQLHAKGHAALLVDNVNLLVERQLIPIGCGRTHGANGRCFRHAPGMGDANALFH